MLNQRKLYKRIFFAPGPVAVKLLSHFEDLFGVDIAGDDQRGIVRHVVTRLNEPHHRRCGGSDRLSITQRLFAARIFVEEPIVHLLIEKVKRI